MIDKQQVNGVQLHGADITPKIKMLITEKTGQEDVRQDDVDLERDKPRHKLPLNIICPRKKTGKDEEESDSDGVKKVEHNVEDKVEELAVALELLLRENPEVKESDEEEVEGLIPRCPLRTSKNKTKELTDPYPVQQNYHRSHNLHCGGLVSEPHISDSQCIPCPNEIGPGIPCEIPKTVEELSNNNREYFSQPDIPDYPSIASPLTVETFRHKLTEEQDNNLTLILEIISGTECSQSVSSSELPPTEVDCYSTPNHSVDSTYGTMSPFSESSPFSLPSPHPIPPPKYDQRLSTSDSERCSLSSTSPQNDWDLVNISQSDPCEKSSSFNISSPISSTLAPQNVEAMPTKYQQTNYQDPTECNFKRPEPKNNFYPNIYIASGGLTETQNVKKNIPQVVGNYGQNMFNIPPKSIYDVQPPVHKVTSFCNNGTAANFNIQKNQTITPCAPTLKIVQLQPLKPVCVPVQELKMKIPASERINLDRKILAVEWAKVLMKKEQFYVLDENDETNLMKVLNEPSNSHGYLEKAFSNIEMARKAGCLDFLKHKNRYGHSALFIAATKCFDMPIIARHIADSIILLGSDPNEVCDDSGNSLLHILAHYGDSHVHVLAELLYAQMETGRRAFNINTSNNNAQTPLHIAAHMHKNEASHVAVVKLLISRGAKLTDQAGNDMTPLHLAVKGSCDPVLVKALLQSCNLNNKDAINLPDMQRNTALHYVASRNDIPLSRQKQVINLLIDYGASHSCHNSDGRVALSLVEPTRKEEIRAILNRRK